MESVLNTIFTEKLLNFSKKIGELYGKNHLNIFFCNFFDGKIDNIVDVHPEFYTIQDDQGNGYATINKKTFELNIL